MTYTPNFIGVVEALRRIILNGIPSPIQNSYFSSSNTLVGPGDVQFSSATAGLQQYVSGILASNSSAVASMVEIKGTTGPFSRIFVPANNTVSFTPSTPIIGYLGEPVFANALTAGTNIAITLTGYKQ